MAKIAVIGAGPMGLACAYELLKQRHTVDVYEADDRVGGMSAHFDFNGLSIERYYHFICKPDSSLFELLSELGLTQSLKWRNTSMGYYFNGRMYDWGNPVALLKFSPLRLLDRIRYGLHMFYCTKISNWKNLDSQEASVWITQWIGGQAYHVLWKRLFALKFFEYANNLSAAWIWSRIKRVGTSRKSLFQEQMGYLDGGSDTLLTKLGTAITTRGGQISLQSPVESITLDPPTNSKILTVAGQKHRYDIVISTIPLPFVPKMITGLSSVVTEQYQAIKNIGVVCLLFKLKKSISRHFWLNISDETIEIPGIIEFSNLRPLPHHVVYVPFYLPQTHPKYRRPDQEFIAESLGYLKKLNPDFTEADVIDVHVSRYGFAQPICPPEFMRDLPPIKSETPGLYIVDTSHYYPEDRSISESVRLGREVANMIAVG
jgi:protoporphyrinogen oxidase